MHEENEKIRDKNDEPPAMDNDFKSCPVLTRKDLCFVFTEKSSRTYRKIYTAFINVCIHLVILLIFIGSNVYYRAPLWLM